VNTKRDVPFSLIYPPPLLCTGHNTLIMCKSELTEVYIADNAVMVGWASMHRFLSHDYDDYGISLRPKWSLEELSS
jgi:N6-L-threonylcarbamoyladenine synthase